MANIILNESSSDLGELFDEMTSVLTEHGFYELKVADKDPADFLSEKEQEYFADAIALYRSIPF